MHLRNKFDVGNITILAEMQPPKEATVAAMVNEGQFNDNLSIPITS